MDPESRSFTAAANVSEAAEITLARALAIARTRKGNVQLIHWDDGAVLRIVAQQGLGEEFLRAFRQVTLRHPPVCGRALSWRRTIVVEDVMQDREMAAYREIAARAGVRRVQSTPLNQRNHRQAGSHDSKVACGLARRARPRTERVIIAPAVRLPHPESGERGNARSHGLTLARKRLSGAWAPSACNDQAQEMFSACMWMESHDYYLSRRARQERQAALKASHPSAREAHLILAGHFDKRLKVLEKGKR